MTSKFKVKAKIGPTYMNKFRLRFYFLCQVWLFSVSLVFLVFVRISITKITKGPSAQTFSGGDMFFLNVTVF